MASEHIRILEDEIADITILPKGAKPPKEFDRAMACSGVQIGRARVSLDGIAYITFKEQNDG